MIDSVSAVGKPDFHGNFVLVLYIFWLSIIDILRPVPLTHTLTYLQ